MVAGRSSFDLCWPIGYKWFPDPTFIQVTLCSPVRAAAFEKIYIFLPAAPFNMSAIIAGKYDECIFIQSLFLQLFQYLPYIIIDAAYHSSISCLGVGLRTIMFPCRPGGLWSEFAASVFVQIGLQVFLRYQDRKSTRL